MFSRPLVSTAANLVRRVTRFRSPLVASVQQPVVSKRVQITLPLFQSGLNAKDVVAETSKKHAACSFHSTSFLAQAEMELTIASAALSNAPIVPNPPKQQWRIFRTTATAVIDGKEKTVSGTFRDTLPWEEDEFATSFVREFLHCKPEKVGRNGMLVYNLNSTLVKGDPDYKNDPVLVFRKRSMEVFELALNTLDPTVLGSETPPTPYSALAVQGSPGIGKSKGIHYPLLKLLQANRTIIFEVARAKKVVALIPPGRTAVINAKGQEVSNTEYVAYSLPLQHWDGREQACAAMHDPDAFFLKDPGTAESASEIAHMPLKMIIVPSFNTRHLGQIVKYTSFFTKFIHPPYELQEALDAQPYIAKGTIDAETIKTRFAQVGGVVRDLFKTEEEYRDRMKEVDAFIRNEMSDDHLQQLLRAASCSKSRLIRALPARDRGESNLFVLCPDASYKEGAADWRSEYLCERVAALRWETLWDKLAWCELGRLGGGVGVFFEHVAFHRLLATQTKWKARSLKDGREEQPQHFKFEPRVDSSSTSNNSSWETFVQVWKGVAKPAAPGGSVALWRARLPNQPVIDFADSLRRGFSCTLLGRKKLSVEQLEHLAHQLDATESEPFRLYVVVPPGRYHNCDVFPSASKLPSNVAVFVLSSD